MKWVIGCVAWILFLFFIWSFVHGASILSRKKAQEEEEHYG